MPTDDIALIDRHMAALRDEVAALRGALEQVATLEREATLHDVLEILGPAIEALVDLEAEGGNDRAVALIGALEGALVELGLSRSAEVGEVHELWPEEADEGFVLDAPVSPGAAMVRVEVVARGWYRGRKVVARPRGRVLEVIDDERDV